MTELPASIGVCSLSPALREFGRRVAGLVLRGESALRRGVPGAAEHPAACEPEVAAALAGAACLALARSEQGHAYLDFDAPVLLPAAAGGATRHAAAAGAAAVELVAFDGHRTWRDVLVRAGVFVFPPREGDLLVLEHSRLYLRRLWDDERSLAQWLHARASGASEQGAAHHAAWLEPLLRDAFGAGSPAEQPAAVRMSIQCRIACVTGGPGTGKTFVVARAILALCMARMLQTAGVPGGAQGAVPAVALLAPTGKAARRMDESVAEAVDTLRVPMSALAHAWETMPPVPGAAAALRATMELLASLRGRATTIHTALQPAAFGEQRFRRGAGAPLDAEIVVVDEASMVSLPLMRALCDAVAPGASLVLLGDRAQLQSVEAGTVLADIDGAHTALARVRAHLTHSRRFPAAGGLGRFVAAIREGTLAADGSPGALEMLQHDVAVRTQVRLVEPEPGCTAARAVALAAGHFDALRDARTPSERLVHLAAFVLLCGHRRGPGGADEINRELARRMAPATGGWSEGRAFDGMPIIVLRNSPDTGVWNGDCGVVCAAEQGALWAHFDGGRRVRVELLPEFAPAYALTVHKSQGSEYGAVLLVLPERESPVLTRELVYTALTRWKAPHGDALSPAHGVAGGIACGVTILARHDVLARALRASVQRASGLAERLERAAAVR